MTLSSLFLAALGVLAQAQSAGSQDRIIHLDGTSQVRLGETFGDLKAAFGSVALTLGSKTDSGRWVDGLPLPGLKVEVGWPYDGKDDNTCRIICVQATQEPWATEAGLVPGSSLVSAEKVYGALSYVDRYVYGREEVHFERQPAGIHFILKPGSNLWGSYEGDAGRTSTLHSDQGMSIGTLEVDRDDSLGDDEVGGEAFGRRLTFLFGQGITTEETWSFFWNLKQAVSSGNAEVIASMVKFPLRTALNRKMVRIRNRQALIRNFKALFDTRVRESIRRARFEDLFTNYQGLMFGRGEVWCDPVQTASGSWTWKIKAINNGSLDWTSSDQWFGNYDEHADHPWSGHD